MSTIVITGASSGIGAAAAAALAADGHEVVVVGRDPERTAGVAERVGGIPMVADFDRISEVRRLAAELAARFDRIDVIANNAGGLLSRRARTADGVERTWQYNVLAPFVLTTELQPLLEASGARVIFTGSSAQAMGAVHPGNPNREGIPWLGGWSAYGAAKRADIMLAKELPRRSSLESYSFHPGFVATRFAGLDRSAARNAVRTVARTPEEGAAPLVFLASVERTGVANGTFFDGMKPDGFLSPQARDVGASARLWDALVAQAASIA